MKGIISFIALATLPVLVMAGGGHAMEHHDHVSPVMSHMAEDTHEGDVGQPGDPKKVTRTIEVVMSDNMRFTPDKLNFKTGQTVRLIVRNNGKIRHEMVIGSDAELTEHANMMRTMPAMKHAESNMVSLAPGERGELVWQFGPPGTLAFACLVPGHREAGMTGNIKVN